jgi:type 1 glutamine amidotransferase
MNYFKISLLTFLVNVFWCVVIHAQVSKEIKIVLIAGPNDHCGDNPCHKYIEDMELVKNCLSNYKSKQKFDIKLYIGERPAINSLDDVDAVIVHSSGDRVAKEWHGIFLQNQDSSETRKQHQMFLDYFDKQIKRGMGLMVMHYAHWVNHAQSQKYMMDWIGGHYLAGKSKVDGNKSVQGTTALETVELAKTYHPVLNGVKGWTTESEFYYNMHFKENDTRVTPLLYSSLPVDEPQQHIVAWATERPDGGRGVGFTEGHFPVNMYIEDFRTFVLNAIVWVAKGTVHKKGIRTKVKKINK